MDMLALLLTAVFGLAAPQTEGPDRAWEGDWFVSDVTDNNTGERKVYAMANHFEANDPDDVTLRIRCFAGKPIVTVEWHGMTFPDQAVLKISPINPRSETAGDARYVFEKPSDPLETGMHATPEASAKIIRSLGSATQASITAYISIASRSVTIPISGTDRAWNRVTKHCPPTKLPLPPL